MVVMRKPLPQAPAPEERETMPPYPVTPTTQPQHPPFGNPPPPPVLPQTTSSATNQQEDADNARADSPDSNMQEDESSDWDASEREDEDEEREQGQKPLPERPQRAAPQPQEDKVLPKPPRTPSYEVSSASQLAGLSIGTDEEPQVTQQKPFNSTNPFLRRQSNGQSSATNPFSSAPLQKPLSPQHTNNVAQGSMSKAFPSEPIANESKSPDASQPPLIPLDTEWLDGTKSSRDNGKGPANASSPSRDILIPGTSQVTRRESSKEKALPSKPVPDVPSAPKTNGVPAPANEPGQQKNEVYHIKHIRWYDKSAKKNPRESPILIQNANGPCPLLALVNALVLTTPPNTSTALVETLHTREQVSLGLLLDAVFDELISGRRGDAAQELPDVGELYSFLLTLHTGMNVNPVFVPKLPTETTDTWKNDVFPAGTFEDTKEMRLYSTFSLPLIHGWIPEQQDSARAAFERSAPTYEDAQNILFREEELEQSFFKQSSSGSDSQLFQDLSSIKEFLHRWPTQLTHYGVVSMLQYLKPGQIAILFRNDHFSMVLKEPQSGKLMSLVTDAGYATHDEIVWESLGDVKGADSEMFSGDFRSVSHSSLEGESSSAGEWTTVNRRKGEKRDQNTELSTQAGNDPSSQLSAMSQTQRTASEQEDHDLALALQLQEEEEQRHRNEQAARRRESQANAQANDAYLSQGSNRQRPAIPERRRAPQAATSPPPENLDGALPTYEEAQKTRPFHPPRSHPANENAPRRVLSQQAAEEETPPPQPPRPQQVPVLTPRRRPARQSLVERAGYPSPFDAGSRGTNEYASYDAISDRREGCRVM